MVCMFAKMNDGEAMYFEQSATVNHRLTLPEGGDSLSFEPDCDILSADYSLQGKERIDMRAELVVGGTAYKSVRHNAIGEIKLDDGTKKWKEANRLYLYYAAQGESVWNIAKHYNTSPHMIWEENDLEHDLLPDKKMLMIPVV